MTSLTGPMSVILQRSPPASSAALFILGFDVGFAQIVFVNTTITGSGNLGSWIDLTPAIQSAVTFDSFSTIGRNSDTGLLFLSGSNLGIDKAVTSVDTGTTWLDATGSLPGGIGFSTIAYGGGVWIAVPNSGNDSLYRSLDNTISWAAVFTPDPGVRFFSNVFFTNGTWFAAAQKNSGLFSQEAFIYRSTDGVVWAQVFNSVVLDVLGSFGRFSSGATKYIAVGNDEDIGGTNACQYVVSSDGVTWSAPGVEPVIPNGGDLSAGTGTISGVEHFDNSTYVIVGDPATGGGKGAWISTDAAVSFVQLTDSNLEASMGAIVKVNDILLTSSSTPGSLAYTTNGSSYMLTAVPSLGAFTLLRSFT